MPRGLRYIPLGWSVEITTSTICGFFLLPATAQFSRIFVGVLGRAQKKFPVKIHAAVAVSSHYHLILTPEDAEQLANFMEHVNGNLAREAGRLIGWRGRFWRERYHSIPISPEPDALVGRLRYVLSNTIKENLVARASEWEGLHCAQALTQGKPMTGVWYARAEKYEAKRRAQRRAERSGKPVETLSHGAFMEHYEVKLAPLPCWANLSTATIRKRVAMMVEEIEAKAAALREKLGTLPLGMENIRNQDPLNRSFRSSRSPKPFCHAASRKIRDRVKRAYRSFVEMPQEAAFMVKSGRGAEAIFPKGSFPPRLSFWCLPCRSAAAMSSRGLKQVSMPFSRLEVGQMLRVGRSNLNRSCLEGQVSSARYSPIPELAKASESPGKMRSYSSPSISKAISSTGSPSPPRTMQEPPSQLKTQPFSVTLAALLRKMATIWA